MSRSLAACEGALLVVDAAQGVEAQTLANAYLAIERQPRPSCRSSTRSTCPRADPDRVKEQIEHVLGIDAHDAVLASAKTGIGIEDVLERIVRDIPPPQGDPDAPLKALIFDSWYDPYRGVVCIVRVVDGTLAQGRQRSASWPPTGPTRSTSWGSSRRKPVQVDELSVGEVGFFFAGIKDLIARADRRHHHRRRPPPAAASRATRRSSRWSSPASTRSTPTTTRTCATRVEKLRLNDASFTFEPESSGALGFGFRCGFLGLLHMEIIQERLEREFNLDLITTAPGVRYIAHTTDGEIAGDREPVEAARPRQLDDARGAVHLGDHHHPLGVRRRPHAALPRSAAASSRGSHTSPPTAC